MFAAVAGMAGAQAWLGGWVGDGAARRLAAGGDSALSGSAPDEAHAGHAGIVSRGAPPSARRFPGRDGLAALGAAPVAPLMACGQAALEDGSPADGEPTRGELERELTALRVENRLLAERVAGLEAENASLEADARCDRMEADMRQALRRDFADVARGSIEAGPRAWSFEGQLVDILQSTAELMRPSRITAEGIGYDIPNPDAFDWPTLRATLGDGLIRSIGQALPGLLRERALAPSVRTSYLCGGGSTTHVQYYGLSDGQIVTRASFTMREENHPLAEAAARDDELSELRYHAAIEAMLGLDIYDDE